MSFLPLPSHFFPFLSLASFLAWWKPKLSFLALLCSETKRHCHCCFCSLSSLELWLQLDYLCQIFYIYFRSLLLYKRQTNSFHHYDSSTPFNTSAARSLAKNVEPFLLGKLGTRLNLFGVTKKQFFDTVFCVGGIGLRGVGKWENHSEEFLKKVKMASKWPKYHC